MTIDPSSYRLAGAVPLDRLAKPTPATSASGASASGAPAGAGPAGGAVTVVEVTEATFQAEVVERSKQVPVVIDFWADWCGPCKQLSPVLHRLAEADGGRWVLATVDVDANPRLSQAFSIQSIPTVIGVIGGRPLEMFAGALPEAQVRQVIDEVLALGEQMGLPGRQTPAAGGEPEAEPVPAYVEQVEAALERDDYDTAIAVYEHQLATAPADEFARQGLSQVRFLASVRDLGDPAVVRQLAADNPTDVTAQIAAADLEVYAGAVDDGFARLIDLVRATTADEREAAREHLLLLFDVVGQDDPRVAKARRALTTALF